MNILKIWQQNGDWSIRRIFATVILIKLITLSGDADAMAMVLAGLIAALLTLSTWQNIKKDEVG